MSGSPPPRPPRSKEAWKTIREAIQDWNKTARLVLILATVVVAPTSTVSATTFFVVQRILT